MSDYIIRTTKNKVKLAVDFSERSRCRSHHPVRRWLAIAASSDRYRDRQVRGLLLPAASFLSVRRSVGSMQGLLQKLLLGMRVRELFTGPARVGNFCRLPQSCQK